jgi:molybdate transport system ATP-binding protein
MDSGGLSLRLRQGQPIPLDVELCCAPGELLALVGPSGSGKSTILRAIAGIFRVADGQITCNGEKWFDSKTGMYSGARQRRIGMVFQNFALFPHLTAMENVMEALAELPYRERERRARDLLRRVHLKGLEHRRPSQLSGGQQQRVGVARALAREPKALLLDEPFSAVDRVTREKLYRELAELRGQLSMPVILVTHDLDEALMLADRISILSQGRTLQTGVPHDVISRPDSVHVARLVGLKNIFHAQVIEHRPDSDETIIEWRGRRLAAKMQSRFAAGSQVAWTIPGAHLVIHLRNRSSQEGQKNQLSGVIVDYLRLGENVALAIQADESDKPSMFTSISLHAAQSNGIRLGAEVTLSLRAGAIHLMPTDRSQRTGAAF